MGVVTTALMASAIGLAIPAIAPASPLFLSCRFTKEVGNPSAAHDVSFTGWERVKIDADNHMFAEADKPGATWVNQCDREGYVCKFGEKAFSVTATGPDFHSTTTIDRYTRKFSNDAKNGDLLSLSYGSCIETITPDRPDGRQF